MVGYVYQIINEPTIIPKWFCKRTKYTVDTTSTEYTHENIYYFLTYIIHRQNYVELNYCFETNLKNASLHLKPLKIGCAMILFLYTL